MADTTSATPAVTAGSQAAPIPVLAGAPTAPRSDRHDGRSRGGENAGRGRQRRGRGGQQSNETQQGNGTPSQGQDGRGRGGRKNQGRGGRLVDVPAASPLAEASKASQLPSIAATTAPADEAEDDEDICFICANPIIYHSVAQCNHRTCHICALRMRALYKTDQCPHCRTDSEFVIFSSNEDKLYEEYDMSKLLDLNVNLGIKFDAKHIKSDTELLLRFNCPDPTCDEACKGWPDLKRHVRKVHQMLLCDCCTQFKKVFTHEHQLYTERDLRKHERYGDDVPGSENQSGFTGHPECDFCRKRFYGSDELYDHCKREHERCFLCDRANPTGNQYFANYDTLEIHFRKDHFLCAEQSCMEKKFVVFASEIDLRAHQVEEHPGGLSKKALQEARRIDMSHFADAHAGPSYGGRGGSSRRIPRDHRRDPQPPEDPPPRADQPLRRDELAFQRTLAVQSAQSTTRRDFGGQLTAITPAIAAPPARTTTPSQSLVPEPPTMNVAPPTRREVPGSTLVTEAFPVLSRVNFQATPTPQPRNSPAGSSSNLPQTAEQARKQKHEAVIDRALFLLNNSSEKLAKFSKYVSNFRAGDISGMDMIDAFWSLFDINPIDLGKLVRELAELFENEAKRAEVLKAWNGWRAMNDDYPLMGSSSSSAPVPTRQGDIARVLNIKSATQRNLRGTANGNSPWLNVSSNTIRNPTTTGSLATLATPKSQGRKIVTPWAGAVKGGPVPASNTRAGPSMGPAPVSAPASTLDFPGLPPKVIKYAPVPRKNEGVAPASVWGGGGASGSGSGNEMGEWEEMPAAASSSKKKGKGKQVLYHFG